RPRRCCGSRRAARRGHAPAGAGRRGRVRRARRARARCRRSPPRPRGTPAPPLPSSPAASAAEGGSTRPTLGRLRGLTRSRQPAGSPHLVRTLVRPPAPACYLIGLAQCGAGRVDAAGPSARAARATRGHPMSTAAPTPPTGTVEHGLAETMKGGVIMDVVTPEQAKIAEDAGAVAVMALERVPADIRAQGGVSRMSDPDMIDGIIEA